MSIKHEKFYPESEIIFLRDELKKSNFELKAAKTSIEFRNIQLKQQEEVIRELIVACESLCSVYQGIQIDKSKVRTLLEKAKSLTTKDKSHE